LENAQSAENLTNGEAIRRLKVLTAAKTGDALPTSVQLLISVAANLGDWLGCFVESGPVLFLSCEEPEPNVRDRIERICKHRGIDPYAIENLHMVFPNLADTWLATVDNFGRVSKAKLFHQVEDFVARHKPALLVIDLRALSDHYNGAK
jgi:RecA-family ATPase